MSIFDNFERTDIEPAGHLIGRFDYLNSSARLEAARVRTVIDDMLIRYPAPHRTRLAQRIKSRDDGQHNSAVFELILHEMLIRQGFVVVEIEPILQNGRAPDFLVEAPNGSRFFCEATLALGRIGADPGADRRMRDTIQSVDNVDSPDFFLCMHSHGMPASQVPTGRLRRGVQAFVNGLDHNAVVASFEAGMPSPCFIFEHSGLHIEIEVVPKKIRGIGGRAIGVRMLPGGIVNPHLPIKTAIEGKAGRYGKFDVPYIIAVNAFNEYANADSAIDALFGTEAVVVRDDEPTRLVRNNDGVWHGAGGPAHTRVSAVLSTERLSAWDLAQRSMRVILNPWATRPLPDIPLGAEVWKVVDNRLVKTPGQTLRDILGLTEEWPE